MAPRVLNLLQGKEKIPPIVHATLQACMKLQAQAPQEPHPRRRRATTRATCDRASCGVHLTQTAKAMLIPSPVFSSGPHTTASAENGTMLDAGSTASPCAAVVLELLLARALASWRPRAPGLSLSSLCCCHELSDGKEATASTLQAV